MSYCLPCFTYGSRRQSTYNKESVTELDTNQNKYKKNVEISNVPQKKRQGEECRTTEEFSIKNVKEKIDYCQQFHHVNQTDQQ